MRCATLLLAVLALGGAAGLAAQEPDSLPPAEAEPPAREAVERPPFSLSLSVGSFGFGTFQSQMVQAERQTLGGQVLDSTLLRRVVEPGGGFQVLASGVMAFGELWGARLGAAYGRTTLHTAYTGSDTVWVITAATLARREATDASVLSAEAALRRWIPSARRVQPYVELGATALRFETGAELPGAAALRGGITRLGGLAAAGGQVPLTDRLSARVQASARVFRTPVDPAPAGEEGSAISTLRTTFEAPAGLPFADDATELTTAIRFELGLTLGLGTPATPPEPEAAEEPSERRGSGVPPSPTRR